MLCLHFTVINRRMRKVSNLIEPFRIITISASVLLYRTDVDVHCIICFLHNFFNQDFLYRRELSSVFARIRDLFEIKSSIQFVFTSNESLEVIICLKKLNNKKVENSFVE